MIPQRPRIVAIAQIYNEIRKGNLRRFLDHVAGVCHELVIYDDASTDGSWELARSATPHVIRGTRNDFANEIAHKQLVLEKALELRPDFILFLDVDEVLTDGAADALPAICARCLDEGADAVAFREVNLWRSPSWKRIDNQFDPAWYVRLWRVQPGMAFDIASGLHQRNYPANIEKIIQDDRIQVLHYGFATDTNIASKYVTYRTHGQKGWALDRLIDESGLRLERVPEVILPPDLRQVASPPQPRHWEEWERIIQTRREDILRPGVSIICLIYRSVAWLEFVRRQVERHTDLRDKEFFFVANDAPPVVLDHLRQHGIPHFVWTNSPSRRAEWYINNVYRAYNYGASAARGDYLLFINSDMAFSPGWFEALLARFEPGTCVASRLVESGNLPTGAFGIEQDFGRSLAEYREADFLEFARRTARPELQDGGLFMPLLIRKADFLRVGGYPEGNIVPGSDLFSPRIARRGAPCVSGDAVLMQKLRTIGVRHATAFDSIVYHFQEGEKNDPDVAPSPASSISAASESESTEAVPCAPLHRSFRARCAGRLAGWAVRAVRSRRRLVLYCQPHLAAPWRDTAASCSYMGALARGARDRRWEPMVACSIPVTAPKDELEQLRACVPAGVPLAVLTGDLGANAPYPLREMRALRSLVALRPGLLHLSQDAPGASLVGALAAAGMGIPYVLTLHSDADSLEGECSHLLPICRYAYQHAAANIVVSEAAGKRLARITGLPAGRFTVIHPGVRLGDFPPIAPDERDALRREWGAGPDAVVVACLGRLTVTKGQAVLVRAIHSLARRGVPAVALLIGDGEDRDRLVELTANLGIEQRVRFLGRRADAARVLAACDVLALPSWSEGLGVALLDGMAAGLPVVASRVGGVPELVSDGGNGLLVPPDDFSALVAALERLCLDRTLRESFSKAAHETVEDRFSEDDMVARTFAVYEQAVGGPSRGATPGEGCETHAAAEP